MKWPDLQSLPYLILRHFSVPLRLHWHAARLLNDLFLIGVVGVVVDAHDRILLFRHTYRRRRPWGLPGGWMMRDESPLQALEREVREESGLIVRADRLLLVGTSDRPRIEFVVGAHFVEGVFQASREVDGAQWSSRDQLPALPLFHLRILKQIEQLSRGEIGWYTTPWIFQDNGENSHHVELR